MTISLALAGPVARAGDWDFDGDVDQFDFVAFQACYSGPGWPADPRCEN